MTERINNEMVFVRKFMELNDDQKKFILVIIAQKLLTDDLLFLIRKIEDEQL